MEFTVFICRCFSTSRISPLSELWKGSLFFLPLRQIAEIVSRSGALFLLVIPLKGARWSFHLHYQLFGNCDASYKGSSHRVLGLIQEELVLNHLLPILISTFAPLLILYENIWIWLNYLAKDLNHGLHFTYVKGLIRGWPGRDGFQE